MALYPFSALSMLSGSMYVFTEAIDGLEEDRPSLAVISVLAVIYLYLLDANEKI